MLGGIHLAALVVYHPRFSAAFLLLRTSKATSQLLNSALLLGETSGGCAFPQSQLVSKGTTASADFLASSKTKLDQDLPG